MSCSLSPLLVEQGVRTGRFATKPSVEAADRRERTAARKADFMMTWRWCVPEEWGELEGVMLLSRSDQYSIRVSQHESPGGQTECPPRST